MADLRKQKRTSRLSAAISLVVHALIIGILTFFAAREGMLGKKMREIAVELAPKEKKPEPEKPKEPEKKIEPPKVETPKVPEVVPATA